MNVSVHPIRDGQVFIISPELANYATQSMICAKAILDTALSPKGREPVEGLAIDFALSGMGFAVASVFSLGKR